MAVNLRRLVSGSQLTTSAATYYTAPAATTTRIDHATLTNTTTSVVTATVYAIPSGGSAGSTNTVISAKGIAPGETYNCPELTGVVLSPAGFLQAQAGAVTAITLMVSGVEVT